MAIGDRKHSVIFEDPRPPVKDAQGGFTQLWDPIPPGSWKVSIEPAGVADQERVAAGTVITAGTSIVRGAYHGGVTTKTRMVHSGKTYSITGVRFVDVRPPLMELAVVEQVRP